MLERYRRKLVLSSMFGCLACLAVASVVTADGRVFLLDLRNSSDGRGVGEAELACGEQRARLASAEELRHAVDECSFAVCTRGWLYGGTVGTTVCNKVGGALKAVGVRTDNVTEDIDHLDAFCIKDTDVPCGDPPSFPNTRLQGHSGFQMGDELLYTCLPGYLMPSGHSVFSLLCDSCGEWYGLVQLCIKDETETPVDYEDKFTDTYGGEEEEEEGPEEAQGGEVYEEVQGEEPRAEEQQQEEEAVFHVAEGGEEHGEEEEEEDTGGVVAEGEEVEEVAGTVPAAAATEQPVSLLSQKHLFWFPSEAFQEEEGPGAAAAAPTRLPATPPTTTTTTPPEAGENRVRASGSQSEESKEYDGGQYQRPAELDHDHVSRERDGDSEQDRDADDSRPDERNDSHYDDLDVYGDGRRDDHTDATRLHEDDEDEDGDRVTHHIVPSQREEEVVVPPRRRIYEDSDEGHDDHYDMGEHEDERRPRHREGHDGDDRGHDDDRDDASEEDQSEEQVVYDEHPGGQEENPDHRDSQEHFDHDRDHDDHGDPDDHDDDDVDHHHHVVLPVDRHHVVVPPATAEPQTVTTGQTPSTTDDTWLDGYAVITDEAEKGGSTQEEEEEEEEEGPAAEEQEEAGVVAGRATDSPNEVVMEVSRPVPYTTGLPDGVPAALSTPEPVAEQGRGAQEVLPGLVPTSAGPSSETSERPPTYPDYDYDIAYPVAPTTRPWEEDELTEGPFLPDHQGPAAPTAYDPDVVTGLWGGSGGAAGGGGAGGGGAGEHNLTGLAGERGEVEGERGESGPHPPPPPPSASGRGPAVAAVIVAVCVVAAAAAVGAWCYRRRQQKSSVYEMNGKNKGQSHSRHGQQIEMQQKV